MNVHIVHSSLLLFLNSYTGPNLSPGSVKGLCSLAFHTVFFPLLETWLGSSFFVAYNWMECCVQVECPTLVSLVLNIQVDHTWFPLTGIGVADH